MGRGAALPAARCGAVGPGEGTFLDEAGDGVRAEAPIAAVRAVGPKTSTALGEPSAQDGDGMGGQPGSTVFATLAVAEFVRAASQPGVLEHISSSAA